MDTQTAQRLYSEIANAGTPRHAALLAAYKRANDERFARAHTRYNEHQRASRIVFWHNQFRVSGRVAPSALPPDDWNVGWGELPPLATVNATGRDLSPYLYALGLERFSDYAGAGSYRVDRLPATELPINRIGEFLTPEERQAFSVLAVPLAESDIGGVTDAEREDARRYAVMAENLVRDWRAPATDTGSTATGGDPIVAGSGTAATGGPSTAGTVEPVDGIITRTAETLEPVAPAPTIPGLIPPTPLPPMTRPTKLPAPMPGADSTPAVPPASPVSPETPVQAPDFADTPAPEGGSPTVAPTVAPQTGASEPETGKATPSAPGAVAAAGLPSTLAMVGALAILAAVFVGRSK